jgi:hypothetical protein
MQFIEKLKELSFKVSSFGSLGEWWLGGFISSFAAVPILYFLRTAYSIGDEVFYFSLVIILVLILAAAQLSLFFDCERTAQTMVLDKVFGVMLAFAFVPIRIKIVCFGVFIFHILNTVQPFEFYRKAVHYMEKMPGLLGLFLPEIFSGILVNVFIKIIILVMK